jgi:hypothetical protein
MFPNSLVFDAPKIFSRLIVSFDWARKRSIFEKIKDEKIFVALYREKL